MSAPFVAHEDADGSVIRVKAVPGAKADAIAGVLGDRLKIRVAAPPEGGRANEAIARLLAETLGLPRRAVEVVAGHGSPEKRLRVRGVSPAALLRLAGAVAASVPDARDPPNARRKRGGATGRKR